MEIHITGNINCLNLKRLLCFFFSFSVGNMPDMVCSVGGTTCSRPASLEMASNVCPVMAENVMDIELFCIKPMKNLLLRNF